MAIIDLFAGPPPIDPERRLLSLAPFEDRDGQHLRLTIGCRLAATSWQARAKRVLMALGMSRAADRILLRARMDIELYAIQPIHGDLISRDGVPPEDLFVPTPPRVLMLELESTPAQGIVYYMLRLRTDKGDAEFPSFEAIVRWALLPE